MDFISNKTVNVIGVMEIAIINNSTSNLVLSIKLFISIYISKTNLDSPKYQTSEDQLFIFSVTGWLTWGYKYALII